MDFSLTQPSLGDPFAHFKQKGTLHRSEVWIFAHAAILRRPFCPFLSKKVRYIAQKSGIFANAAILRRPFYSF